MYRIVEFPSEGATLRGRYYVSPDSSTPIPIIIMAYGFSCTITGMVADNYAEAFHEAGFAVLLYDHRNFGISDGEPRQEINKWVQARGYRDAIDFVTTLPEIDASRIAIWGDSMSGNEVRVVGALDERVSVVVAQVPAIGRTLPPPDPDGELFAALRETFFDGDVNGTPETTSPRMPVVSFDQGSIPSLLTPLTAYRWFIEYGCRYGTGWENWGTRVNPDTPAPLSAVLSAPYLKAPVLMLMSPNDEMPGANSDVARMAWELTPEPKELVEVDGGHFGIVQYPSPLFDQAVNAQKDFLIRQLM